MRRLALLLAIQFLPLNASANDITLLELHGMCHSKEIRFSSACAGFMSGFVQGIQQGQEAAAEGKTICFPDGFKMTQMNLILDKIVRDGPQFSNLAAVPGLVIPLQAAFPCRKK